MLFSCKISNSVLSFLDRHGEDFGSLYENAEWPTELLRDPTYWLEANKMEGLLEFLTSHYGHTVPDSALPGEVGRQAAELRGWGALDSVLRLVQSPRDLLSQPERFLSYFISPAPPVGNVKREAEEIKFELPLDSSEYPLVVQYMRAAFEALPTYVGRPPASAQWQGSQVTIKWNDSQESLFSDGAPNDRRTVNPDLVRNVLQNLEESQRRLEETKVHLARKTEEVDSLRLRLRQANSRAVKAPQANPQVRMAIIDHRADHRADASEAPQSFLFRTSPALRDPDVEMPLRALDHAHRLSDYLGRAQQLVTILVGQGRATPQVQEAMRRLDWSTVQVKGPQAVHALIDSLQDVRPIHPTDSVERQLEQQRGHHA